MLIYTVPYIQCIKKVTETLEIPTASAPTRGIDADLKSRIIFQKKNPDLVDEQY